MAGYREFQTGEVLTAANVNSFLMEQATMTFADAAARDAALAGVLREGLLTYNLDTNRLEVYDGTDWVEPAPEPPAGIGSNVVQTVKTDTFTTTSATFEDITGLAVTITPTSASSKILVLCSLQWGGSGASPQARLVGGNIANSFTHKTLINLASQGTSFNFNAQLMGAGWMVVDNPASTSPQTYKAQARGNGGAFQVNRNTSGSANVEGASSIIAIEVSA